MSARCRAGWTPRRGCACASPTTRSRPTWPGARVTVALGAGRTVRDARRRPAVGRRARPQPAQGHREPGAGPLPGGPGPPARRAARGDRAGHGPRAAGRSPAATSEFWDAARRRHGDSAGTRVLIEVLLLHRTLPAEAVLAGDGRRGAAGPPRRRPRRGRGPPPPRTPPRRGPARPAHGAAGSHRRAPIVRADPGRLRQLLTPRRSPHDRPPSTVTGADAPARRGRAPTDAADQAAIAAGRHRACTCPRSAPRRPDRRRRGPGTADPQGVPRRGPHRRMRRPRRPPPDPAGQRGEVPPPQTAGRLRPDACCPACPPATLAAPRRRRLDRRRRTRRAARRLRHRQDPPAHRPRASPPPKPAAGSATSPPPRWSTNSSRPPTTNSSPASWAATPASICSASTRSATSTSTPAAPSCSSRSSPHARRRASIACATNAPFSEWGTHLHRPPPRRRRRRPTHLPRPHHRHRHRLLPAALHPRREERSRPWLNPHRAGDTSPHSDRRPSTPHKTRGWGQIRAITVGPNRVVILTLRRSVGTTVVCTGPGTAYTDAFAGTASPDCGHAYTASSAGRPGDQFTVTAASDWVVGWVGAGRSGTIRMGRAGAIGADRGRGAQVLVISSPAPGTDRADVDVRASADWSVKFSTCGLWTAETLTLRVRTGCGTRALAAESEGMGAVSTAVLAGSAWLPAAERRCCQFLHLGAGMAASRCSRGSSKALLEKVRISAWMQYALSIELQASRQHGARTRATVLAICQDRRRSPNELASGGGDRLARPRARGRDVGAAGQDP